MNFYLADDAWLKLAADLVKAADHPADPETAVKEILANANIMPESSRADVEAEAFDTLPRVA